MSQRAAEFATDVVTWWNEHRAESGDVMKRIERLETLCSNLLSALTFVLEDLRDLEGRPSDSLGRRLWTPAGMKFSGDPAKFG